MTGRPYCPKCKSNRTWGHPSGEDGVQADNEYECGDCRHVWNATEDDYNEPTE